MNLPGETGAVDVSIHAPPNRDSHSNAKLDVLKHSPFKLLLSRSLEVIRAAKKVARISVLGVVLEQGKGLMLT